MSPLGLSEDVTIRRQASANRDLGRERIGIKQGASGLVSHVLDKMGLDVAEAPRRDCNEPYLAGLSDPRKRARSKAKVGGCLFLGEEARKVVSHR